MSEPSFSVSRVRRALALSSPESAAPAGDSLAAVAAILREGRGGSDVLLIRRATRDGDPWSGHMAFPGGRQEPSDRDSLHTAVRETREEIGVDLNRYGHLLGRLEGVAAIARGRSVGMTIVPYVFQLTERRPWVTNEEVEEVIWAPMAQLAGGTLDTTVRSVHAGQELELPAWNVEGRIVWGLTYRMLSLLITAVRETPVD